MPQSSPKTTVGENLQKQLQAIADQNFKLAQSLGAHGPGGWMGPVLDENKNAPLAQVAEACTRKQHADEFIATVRDGNDPGTRGDLGMCQMQGDMLAAMERAYRMRRLTPIRARAHAGARAAGHADDSGPVLKGFLGYFVELDRRNKSEQE